MARPRTYTEKRVATAVRLPESVHRRLHDAAADRDVSANLLVTRAVDDYLHRLAEFDRRAEFDRVPGVGRGRGIDSLPDGTRVRGGGGPSS